ncbi:hypothetical protein BGW41_004149 [Actinomortierella wolfii]|nr:hypothetical protein BGW41_004149 [Actinomortierella wolfii]
MPIAEAPLNADNMTIPTSPDTKMEAADSAETVVEELDMNLDSFKISQPSGPNKQQLQPEVDEESQNRDMSEYGHHHPNQEHQHHRYQAKHPSEEQGDDEQKHKYDQEQQQHQGDQPEPRLASLSRLALALAQEEEDAKQGSNHDRYVSQRDGDIRRDDLSEHDDHYHRHSQHNYQHNHQHQQRGSPPPPAAHIHSYSDREAPQDGHSSHYQPHSSASSSSYMSSSQQQPPHSHAHHHSYTRHTQPQPRQLPPLSPVQQSHPNLPSSSSPPLKSTHAYSSSHPRYPLPSPGSSSMNAAPYHPYPAQHSYGEQDTQRRPSASDEGSDPDMTERAQHMSPYQQHPTHGSPQWSRQSSASYHFHQRPPSPQRSAYRSPPSSYNTSFSPSGPVAAASYSGSSDPYRAAYEHTPYKSQPHPTMPVSPPPTHPRHSYSYSNSNNTSNNNNYDGGPLPALAPRPSQPYMDDRSPRSGPRPGSPHRSPRSSMDSRSSSGMKHGGKDSMTGNGQGVYHTSTGATPSGATISGGVVIQSARGTPKGPLPIEVQIKLLRSVLQHDPFNCAIRKTTHAWESISREQGIRARTCARRFDNIIQAYIAGRDKPVGTEEQQRTKKELLEKLFEMMNQPQALKRMQKKRRYRSEESDRRLLLETIRLNPFAQKVGQVAKAWEDIRDALGMKVHARQCIRRVNRMVKPYLLRERMYRGNIPEEMREANDDLIKQVIQLMKQAGGNQLDDDDISNASEDSASGMSESEDDDMDEQENPRVKRRASAEDDDMMGTGAGGEDDNDEMKDQQSESERNRHARHTRQGSQPPSSQQGSPRMGGHRSSQRNMSRRGRSRTVTASGQSQGGSMDIRSIRGEDYRSSGQYSTPSISTTQGPPSASQSSTVVTPTTPSFPPNAYEEGHDYRYSSKYSGSNPTLPSPIHPTHSSPSYPSSSSHYYYSSGVVSPTRPSELSYPRWPPNPAHFIDVDGSGYKRPTKHARADSHGSRFQLSDGGVNQVFPHPQQHQSSPSSSGNFAASKPVFKNEQGQDMRYAPSSSSQHLQQPPRSTMFKSPVMDRYDSSADRQSRTIQLNSNPSGSPPMSSMPPSTSSSSTSLPVTAPSPALSTRAMDVDSSHGHPPHPPQAHPQYPQQSQQQQHGNGAFNNANYPPPPMHSRSNSSPAVPQANLLPPPPQRSADDAAAPTAQQYREVLDELSSIKQALKQLDQQRRQDMEVQQRMAQMIEELQQQLHASKGL